MMNNKNNQQLIFEPDFFERVILAESLAYENLSFLSVAEFILNSDTIFQDGDIAVFSVNNSVSVLMKSTEDYQIDLSINSRSGLVNEKEYCNGSMQATILRHRYAIKGQGFIEKENMISLLLPAEHFFSKAFFYGKWRSGLEEHLYRTMRNFIHTKENHFNSVRKREHI
ncbi:hypothetical protein A7P61_03595 (plasmid) [Pantoea agglomerans pv. betae]|uniref:hypothetical protein n=1 Tax=Enterobacter agglomerans TaxID=549 RepID=UPI0007E534B1|nr:hypothetical protein [Pantoea agglomerans]WHU82397.1 hypothetical protein A7P61_03595 [Pantoea agglomerans pv. betae]